MHTDFPRLADEGVVVGLCTVLSALCLTFVISCLTAEAVNNMAWLAHTVWHALVLCPVLCHTRHVIIHFANNFQSNLAWPG